MDDFKTNITLTLEELAKIGLYETVSIKFNNRNYIWMIEEYYDI